MNPDPIRVLLIESGRSFGGTERVVDTLARRLDRERFHPWVVLEESTALDDWADDLRRTGVPVERCREISTRFQWRRAWGWFCFLRRHRGAILHLHHVWSSADRYIVPIAHLAGMAAVVVTEHLGGPPHSRWQRFLKRWEVSRADVSITVSRAVGDMLCDGYGLSRDQFEVVANGVRPPTMLSPERRVMLRSQWRVPENTQVWLFVGRPAEQKGVDLLLAAWAALATPRPLLLLVGEGSQRALLEERMHTLLLSDSVRFLGSVQDVGPIYGAADALIMPSRFEGMPLVLLEAMMAGLPIVATRVGGIAEATHDGEFAHLVSAGKAQELTAAVIDFQKNRHRVAERGRRAAVWASERYGEQRMVENYETLYRRALRLTQAATAGRRQDSEAA